MQLVWTSAARADILSAHDFIASDNVAAADATIERVVVAVERLSPHPRIGRPGRLSGTRELAVSATPYLVVYAIDEPKVVILRVLHGAMSWPPRSDDQRK
jgi:toxin ParE1/3/4